MLQKQKKQMMQPGNTALWLANNPASDKLQSKHPVQISTTKFVDNQLSMLANNSNTSTARGTKKHNIGLSPSQHPNSETKKDGSGMADSRKKTMGDLARVYESAPGASNQNILGLSKSIAKDKFHQQNLGQLNSSKGMTSQQKIPLHMLNNKLAVGSNQGGYVSSHTLKKSSSTRQVVNLLDLQ